MKGSPCFVYVMATVYEDGVCAPVKIGIANDPRSRLKEVQTGSARKLTIAACLLCDDRESARMIEADAHENCADMRMAGEWFDADVGFAISSVMCAYLYYNGCQRLFVDGLKSFASAPQ